MMVRRFIDAYENAWEIEVMYELPVFLVQQGQS